MNKKEQEFINQIKKESETVNIPKSLEPEEMEAALKSRPKKFVWKKEQNWKKPGMQISCVHRVRLNQFMELLQMKGNMHTIS